MKPSLLILAALAAAFAPDSAGAPLVYRGQLRDRGVAATGIYDVRITVHRDALAIAPLGAPLTFAGVRVVDGAFRLEADLPGGVPDGAAVWIELAVRENGDSAFETIGGREKVALSPTVGACWSTVGDGGSDASVNFLGTTDAQPLVLRVQNQRVARFEPSALLAGGAPVTANVIQGSVANSVIAGVRGATIAGGGVPSDTSDPAISRGNPNLVTDAYGTVSGGAGNRAGDGAGTQLDAAFATVGGGQANIAAANYSVVTGGDANTAIGATSTIGGGEFNGAIGAGTTIAGGYGNLASGGLSVIGGGMFNLARGDFSSVGGGGNNCAGGDFSLAAGNRAKVRPGNSTASACGAGVPNSGDADGDEGSFVWADAQAADFVTSGANQFVIRADGGAMFNTSALPNSTDDLVIAARANSGDADSDLSFLTRGARRARIFESNINGTLYVDALSLDPGAVAYVGFGNGAYLSFGGVFTNSSSRELKEAFAAIDPRAVLEQVLALPINTWSYKGSTEGRHLGPVAEDFKRAFGLAGDGRSIGTVDADGVALAAIQGLNAKLEAENASLRERLEAIEQRLRQLSATLKSRSTAAARD